MPQHRTHRILQDRCSTCGARKPEFHADLTPEEIRDLFASEDDVARVRQELTDTATQIIGHMAMLRQSLTEAHAELVRINQTEPELLAKISVALSTESPT